MKERPILFGASMVRAILEGRKTQTRRIMRPQIVYVQADNRNGRGTIESAYAWPPTNPRRRFLDEIAKDCPLGLPDDRLWVREAWRAPSEFNAFRPSQLPSPGRGLLGAPIVYEASRHPDTGYGKLRPGMFMPRWACRITLDITDVRIERLQNISDADAFAEGVQQCAIEGLASDGTARGTYRALWDSINGFAAWDANPWVWVITFARAERLIKN